MNVSSHYIMERECTAVPFRSLTFHSFTLSTISYAVTYLHLIRFSLHPARVTNVIPDIQQMAGILDDHCICALLQYELAMAVSQPVPP